MPPCHVPGCRSGSAKYQKYLEENGLPKTRFFQAPNEEMRAQWDAVIENTKVTLTLKSRVCSYHFKIEDVELYFETILPDGTVDKIPRDRARLRPTAVPSIFGDYPKYYQAAIKEDRNSNKNNTSARTIRPNLKSIPRTVQTKAPEPLPLPPVPVPTHVHSSPLNTPVLETNSSDEISPCSSILESNIPIQIPTSIWSYHNTAKLIMPVDWVVCNTAATGFKKIAHIHPKTDQIDKKIIFHEHTDTPTIQIRGVEYHSSVLNTPVTDERSAQNYVNVVDKKIKVCRGTGFEKKPFSVNCQGGIEKVKGNSRKRCMDCAAEWDRIRKLKQRQESSKNKKKEKLLKLKRRNKKLKRSQARLLLKLQKLLRNIEKMKNDCAMMSETALQDAINVLPKAQQEAVRACFSASKKKGPSGRRYTSEWIYECLLMRIKDKKLYNHLRKHEVLPLPCETTINKYLRHFGGTYGFQPQTLKLLKEKTRSMEEKTRRGIILIDEMKLTEGVYFDDATLQVLGFKDMGEDRDLCEFEGESFTEAVEAALHNLTEDPKAPLKIKRRAKTQEKNKNRRDKNLGDHALVITFQPFMGTWVQAVACFLTRNNATDYELTRLVLETVLLLENSGLYVDGVVTDGAAWNRSMWTKFGVTRECPSAQHPCNTARRLWFLSDFPHPMKCMRNCLVSKKIILTPDGDINIEDWKAVLEAEKLRQVGLRKCHKLTEDHLSPNPWQKMNVAMAWQFWSATVATAMDAYRTVEHVVKLKDSATSAKFCKMVNDLADVMNSNRPQKALRLHSPDVEAIDNFLKYFEELKNWSNAKLKTKLIEAENIRVESLRQQGKRPRGKSEAYFEQEDYIFSESTNIGLIVTLKATKEILKFLTEDCKYEYLMTARLNQDALERFFGLVRQSCGGNTHPEPRVFAQLFRLLSIYSLVKPLRGSNITGGEMLNTLLNLNDFREKTKQERHQLLSDKLDEIIINGQNLENIGSLMQQQEDHNYMAEGVDEFTMRYVAGFVARHSQKYTKGCDQCETHLKKKQTQAEELDILITNKSKGFLTYASDELLNLLREIESTIICTSLHNEFEENILFHILDNLKGVELLPVGCELHAKSLTKSILKFYLIMRLHFVTRRWNLRTREVRKAQKGFRKQANLT